MRRKWSVILSVIFLCVAFVGCATQKMVYKPYDLNTPLAAGQFIQKTDNFVVLFDKSSSMDDPYAGTTRLELAKDVVKRMAATIPNLKLNAGLRTFWNDDTKLVYGMASYEKGNFLKPLDCIMWGSGNTPMAKAILAAGNDMASLTGNSAIIIVSDFEHIENLDDMIPKNVMAAVAKLKEQYGNRLCIYPVMVGNAPKGKSIAREIAKDAGCGASVNADDLGTAAAMGAFVEKIFLGPAKETGVMKAEEAKTAADAGQSSVKGVTATIHFDFDKSAIKPAFKKTIADFAAVLVKNPDAKVVIDGYTDYIGTAKYNIALSDRRANSFKKVLVKKYGIDASRIRIKGFGKTDFIAPNKTSKGRYENRRATAIIE
ncbi:MAG: OmpA family protein [Syntrophales bacterium]